MWSETETLYRIRHALGAAQFRIWAVTPAKGRDLSDSTNSNVEVEGLFVVFSSMCIFTPHKKDARMFRWGVTALENVTKDDERKSIAFTSAKRTFVLSELEFLFSAWNALSFLKDASEQQVTALSHAERAAIIFPQETLLLKSIGFVDSGEYVVMKIGETTFTTNRILQPALGASLAGIQMIRRGPQKLEIVLNTAQPPLILKCSDVAQDIILWLWFLALPIQTKYSSGKDKDLRTHVQQLERLHKQFCAIDKSRDGVIVEQELRDSLGPLFACSSFVGAFFNALDEDHDKSITFQEFASGLSTLLKSDTVAKVRFSFRMFDTNHDGNLSKEELFSALHTLTATGDLSIGEDELKEVCESMFTLMDLDDSGYISVDEYAEALEKNSQVHELLRRIGLPKVRDTLIMEQTAEFSANSISFGDPKWIIAACLTQSVLVTLNAGRNRVGSGGALTREMFSEVVRFDINAPPSMVEQYGDRMSNGRTFKTPTLHSYAPQAFCFLRKHFKVSDITFTRSLGLDNLVANMLLGSRTTVVSAPCGETFKFAFQSTDQRFLIHSLTESEKNALVANLPKYVDYIKTNPHSLLPRYIDTLSIFAESYALHFVIMLNPLYGQHPCTTTCFLKGNPARSNHIEQDKYVLFEADIKDKFELCAGWKEPFHQQFQADVLFLESIGSAGYTLVVGTNNEKGEEKLTDNFNYATSMVPRGHPIEAPTLSPPQQQQSSGGWSCCKKPSAVKESPVAPRQIQQPSSASKKDTLKSLDSTAIYTKWEEGDDSAHLEGRFYSFDGGMLLRSGRSVHVGIWNIFAQNGEGLSSSAYSQRLISYATTLIAGQDDVVADEDIPSDEAALRKYGVTLENGKIGTGIIDTQKKKLRIVTTSGKVLLSVPLVRGSGFNFIRHHSFSDKYKAKLMVRCISDGQSSFDNSKRMTFPNLLEREKFMSDVFRTYWKLEQDGMQLTKGRIFVGTWNVGEAPPSPLASFFRCCSGQSRPEIVCMAAQEATYTVKGQPLTQTNEEEWFERISSTLPEYQCVSARSLWGIRLIVLVHHSAVGRISNIVSASIATGVSYGVGKFGNKGGIAIGLKLDETSLCFVGCHLAAHQSKVDHRNRDYCEIVEAVSKELNMEGVDFLNAFHHVFWCGDLNYRLDKDLKETIELIRKREYSQLWPVDQLRNEMKNGNVFKGFQEPAPQFDPTYKFERETPMGQLRVYDESQQRIPSWCDRVLHHSKGHPIDAAVRTHYDADHSIRSSDHSPVYSIFEINVRHQFVIPISPIPNVCHKLIVSGLGCKDLLKADTFGLSDPWIKFLCPFISASSEDCRTPTIMKTLNPEWEEEFEFSLFPVGLPMLATEYLTLVLYDEDYSIVHDPLGQAVLPLDVLMTRPQCCISLPVMLYGVQCGSVSFQLALQTK